MATCLPSDANSRLTHSLLAYLRNNYIIIVQMGNQVILIVKLILIDMTFVNYINIVVKDSRSLQSLSYSIFLFVFCKTEFSSICFI